MVNLAGIFAAFNLVRNPAQIIPHAVVKDVRHIDFVALRRMGYTGAVFDKDNCLTLPNRDQLVPELQEAWKTCNDTFPGRVLIVSNSAGTEDDPGGLEAESVSRHLGVPVLIHRVKKPGVECISQIRQHFREHVPLEDESASKPGDSANRLVVIGDRLVTDMVMANRMSAYGIWTRGLWQKNDATFLRFLENSLLRAVQFFQARQTPRHSSPKPPS